MSVHTAAYIRKESRIPIAVAKCARKGAKKMIKIEKVSIHGLEETIRGMRNPMNSWAKSDSGICKGGDDGIGCKNCANEVPCEHTYDHSFQLGKADHELMMKLAAGGPVHAKYRRMITVYLDITAPLYWWKEFDTYKVGTVANSCSTMHKIQAKEFTLEDFSHEHILGDPGEGVLPPLSVLKTTIDTLNAYRALYVSTDTKPNRDGTALSEECCRKLKKDIWWQMIQLLPSSYNQKRTVMLNYEVLVGIYCWRKEHKLDEWREFCRWIEQLPYSEIITGA
jgi:hypothetical protein